mmetsp:Transcript_23309/g.59602  ORF Transcript_23309/g.59602 Transcript_23309/m.59602 type:complete len:393 (-) Transcript_23309:96-1274(-)
MVQTASGGYMTRSVSAASKASGSPDSPTASSASYQTPTTGSKSSQGGKRGGGGGSSGSSQAIDWQRVTLGFFCTVLWMLFSSALIILNKHLYRMGFEHPCFVTGMGQVFSAMGGYAYVKAGFTTLRPMPPAHTWVTRLAPIIASTAATMFFGNAAYLTLSVAFIQILKAFTPALTLVLCVLAGLERPQWPLALSVLLIAGGTASAVLVERGTASFHMGGFLHFMASSITEAARVVGAEVLLGAQRFNSAEALVYIGGPAAAVLLLMSAVQEGAQIWGQAPGAPGPGGPWLLGYGTGALLVQHPAPFLAAFTMSFLVNLSCFFAIQYTSSLTFKVAGCVKNVAVVWYGVVMHNEVVSPLQMVGYFVSVIGFAMYSRLKLAVKKHKRQHPKKTQ